MGITRLLKTKRRTRMLRDLVRARKLALHDVVHARETFRLP